MEASVFSALVLLGGLAAVQLISILKNALKWEGDLALVLTFAVSGVVGVVLFGIAYGPHEARLHDLLRPWPRGGLAR